MTFVGSIYQIKCSDCNHNEDIKVGFIEETQESLRPFYCSECCKIEYSTYTKKEKETGEIIRYCQKTGKQLIELIIENNTDNKKDFIEIFNTPRKTNIELLCPKCKSKNVMVVFCGMT